METLQLTPYTRIENQDFPQGLTITINSADFAGVAFTDGRITFSVSGCRIKKLIIENPDEIAFKTISVGFTNCYIEDIEVKQVESSVLSLAFFSCIIRSGAVKNVKITGVHLNNCICESLFLIDQQNVHFSYTESNLYAKPWIKMLESDKVKPTDALSKKQALYIYDCQQITINFEQPADKKPGLYRIPYQMVDNNKIGYRLSPEEKGKLDLHLTLKYSIGKGHLNTKIHNAILSALSISGYAEGEINIDNTSINSWYIRDFTVENSANFYNIHTAANEKSKVEIHKSNLDKVWFDNVRFSSYSVVSFFRTKFGKTSFTACDFPKSFADFSTFQSLENVHYPEKKAARYYKDQYEIFLQLRQQLESQGNIYESQRFLALANETLLSFEDVDFWDKIILWLNSVTNYHGVSIKKPLCIFFILLPLLYLIYLWSLGLLFVNTPVDLSLAGYYFAFIDLTHRTDFLVQKEELTGWAVFFDYAGKLAGGYLIYQFIAAFRKYGKK